MVFAARRIASSRRERVDSESHGGLSSRRLSRALLDSGEPSVFTRSTPGATADVVQVALQRGREDPRQTARRGRQVSAAQEVSVAEDDLGRRGGGVLLQGAIEKRVETVLHENQVPAFRGEEESGEGDRLDLDSGGQLVQESTAEGSHAANENVSPS